MGSAGSIQEQTIFAFDYKKDFYQKYSDKNAYDKWKNQLEIQRPIDQKININQKNNINQKTI
jgi:hypothetical protein